MSSDNQDAKKKNHSFNIRNTAGFIVGGALACGITHVGTLPFDFLKVLRQTSSSIASTKNWSLLETFHAYEMVIVGYCLQGIFKFGIYATAKFYAVERYNIRTFWSKMGVFICSAVVAEVVADYFLYPFEQAKIVAQNEYIKNDVSDLQWGAIPKTFASAFFLSNGYLNFLAKQVISTTVKFVCFELCMLFSFKYIIKKFGYYREADEPKKSLYLRVFLCGLFGGAISSVASQPFDYMVTCATTGKPYVPEELFNGLFQRTIQFAAIGAVQWFVFKVGSDSVTALLTKVTN